MILNVVFPYSKPSIEWNTSSAAEAERAEAERAAILQLETHLAAASNAKLPVTEHSSRLLSQVILTPDKCVCNMIKMQFNKEQFCIQINEILSKIYIESNIYRSVVIDRICYF